MCKKWGLFSGFLDNVIETDLVSKWYWGEGGYGVTYPVKMQLKFIFRCSLLHTVVIE